MIKDRISTGHTENPVESQWNRSFLPCFHKIEVTQVHGKSCSPIKARCCEGSTLIRDKFIIWKEDEDEDEGEREDSEGRSFHPSFSSKLGLNFTFRVVH